MMKSNWLRAVVALLVWWLWLPLLGGAFVWWMAYGPFLSPDGYKWTHDLALWVNMSVLHGAIAWLYVGIGLLGTAVILAFFADAEHQKAPRDIYSSRIDYMSDVNDDKKSRALWPLVGLSVMSVVAAFVTFGWPYATTLWDNDKDYGRYYADSTVFYVNNPASSIPDSLKNLTDGATAGDGCDLLGRHDVRGCVKKGSLSDEGWDARVSSLEGAKNAIKRKTDGVQRVSLEEATVSYLNARGNIPAAWSGVLNGSGREQPLYGVAEWSGKNDPQVCRFEGKYAIQRAFGGDRGNSLDRELSVHFPSMRWDLNDVWGYCDSDQPIVVVPMTKPVKWMHRTVDTAAGIVLVQGDNGKLKLTHKATVKAGEYRGSVYPGTLVAKQRSETQWAAGRKNKDRFSFGYDPSEAAVQAGNSAEYLLRDKKTGRNVFVTPLTLRSSTSEVFVAYSVTYADEVKDGQLNELSVYVLDRDDKRLVNIDQLAAEANDWMSQNAGMFRANEGKLIEFTPIDGDTWRVFGEMGGQVVYQLDISASRKITPKLVSVGSYGTEEKPQGNTSPEGTQPGVSQCAPDLSKLDNGALSSCLDSVTSEVKKRLGQS